MKITDINPFVRMASHISYNPSNRQGFPRDCRIIFITCGNADVIIENKHYNISKDSLVYIRSGLPYKICGQSKVQLYILNFDLTTNNSGQTTVMPVLFDKTVNVTSDHITDADFLNSHICISNGAKFRPEIDLITSEMADKQTLSREMAGAILKQLVIKINRFLNTESTNDSPIAKVANYIHKNFTSELTNKQLAAIAGYHEYHLNRIFRQKYGKSIRQYIIDLRIKHAKQLLISDSRPVSEIAEACGFSSNTYFSSYFSRKNGCTPSEYRNKYRYIV